MFGIAQIGHLYLFIRGLLVYSVWIRFYSQTHVLGDNQGSVVWKLQINPLLIVIMCKVMLC